MIRRNRAEEEGDDTDITLMTIKEVAEAFKFSPQSVRRLQYGRHVPFFKIGGSIRFAKADIARYLEQQKIDSMH